GAENFFLFGMTAPEVLERRKVKDHAAQAIAADPRLARALAAIEDGTFSGGDTATHADVAANLRGHDWFLVCSDFTSYWEKSREVDAAFADRAGWTRMAALNTARSGWFSSDRTIRGYMADVWGAEPLIDAPDPLRAAAE
ncbi:MAG: glycogen/starch/alpha-glucan phosphorylase, partial [Paracoccaceae bacterium]|nr:glycogen/starch/alpha-glucan phosphorylase [Paracoccaceae bacterium]